ncbi:cellulase family glycosylhydrolase [Embleya sp. NBC_00896]|uniref:cellulase family glycosylhydrolase n=1 Tax=Embleya sp. NBC_00896 TaxID=2975961 RepID=UPI00386F8692|nr:cellulase family glycosylhydrolase [Embleya sp. NBC_00896]
MRVPTRTRLHLAGVIAGGLLLATVPAPAYAHGGSHGRTPDKVTVGDRTFIADAKGRATQWRGFNVGDKDHRGAEAFKNVTEAQFRDLAARGYNLARVLFFWDDLEPRPGRYSRDYLAKMNRVLGWAAKYDIKVVLDAHQDIYGPYFSEHRGNPEWTTRDEGLPYEPVPGDWFAEYYTPGVQAAFDHLYNDRDLQRAHAAMWMKVAATFGRHPAVLGYDLMNEPMGRFRDGEDIPTAAARLESTQITDMWNRLTDAIRLVDRRTWIFVEPTPIVGLGVPTALGPITDDKVVYAPHFYESAMETGADYDPDGGFVENYEAAITAYPKANKLPVIVGEWGPPDQSLPNIPLFYKRMTAAMDRFGSGWAGWQWCNGGGYCTFDADGRMKPNNTLLVQPYARAVAGNPETYRYDLDTRTYTLTFTTRRNADGPTEIVLPKSVYPKPPNIRVDGPARAHTEVRDNTLRLTTPKDGRYTITITPRP